jgi:hypothetical protein
VRGAGGARSGAGSAVAFLGWRRSRIKGPRLEPPKRNPFRRLVIESRTASRRKPPEASHRCDSRRRRSSGRNTSDRTVPSSPASRCMTLRRTSSSPASKSHTQYRCLPPRRSRRRAAPPYSQGIELACTMVGRCTRAGLRRRMTRAERGRNKLGTLPLMAWPSVGESHPTNVCPPLQSGQYAAEQSPRPLHDVSSRLLQLAWTQVSAGHATGAPGVVQPAYVGAAPGQT